MRLCSLALAILQAVRGLVLCVLKALSTIRQDTPALALLYIIIDAQICMYFPFIDLTKVLAPHPTPLSQLFVFIIVPA